MASDVLDVSEELNFLDKIIEINMSLNDLVDDRASFLSGIAGIIAVVSLTQLFSATGLVRIGFLVITLTGLVTIFLSVGVIRPKSLKKKRINLMYYGGICHYDEKKYYSMIKDVLENKEDMVKEYVKEIHDLSDELKARFKLIRRTGDVLVSGLIAGFILIFLSFLMPL
ncbi:MAG: Pycsar system effector family protein [Candidatus Aenigmatarchaeota archaeon]